jgi:hypothetical protein
MSERLPFRGEYGQVQEVIERPWSDQDRFGRFLVVPLHGRDDCMATAMYQRATPPMWRLVQIIETCPPMSPQEKALQFSDDRALPPLTPDGRIDYEAIAARREREWREYESKERP